MKHMCTRELAQMVMRCTLDKLGVQEYRISPQELDIAEDSINSDDFFDPLFALYSMSDVTPDDPVLTAITAVARSHGVVIDLGSGVGRYALALATLGYDVVSVERSQYGSLLQRIAARTMGISLVVHQSDMYAYRHDTNVDIVLSLFTSMQDGTCDRLRQAFAGMAAQLKAGGVILFDSVLWENAALVFPQREVAKWQFGNIDKTASLSPLDRRVALLWQWRFTGGSATKFYNCMLPTRRDVLRAASECNLEAKEIWSPSRSHAHGTASTVFALRVKG